MEIWNTGLDGRQCFTTRYQQFSGSIDQLVAPKAGDAQIESKPKMAYRAIGTSESDECLPEGLARVLEDALWEGLPGLCPQCWPKLLDKGVNRSVIEEGAQSDRQASNLVGGKCRIEEETL